MLDQSFDENHYDAANTYYYFSDLATGKYTLYSEDSGEQYLKCDSGLSLSSQEFSNAQNKALQELKKRSLESCDLRHKDNMETLLNLYNVLNITDENEVAFGRAYNFMVPQGESAVQGYLLLSTHKKQALQLEYEENDELPDDYEKVYYLNQVLYFYKNGVYYDDNGDAVAAPQPTMSTFSAGSSSPDPTETESVELIDELNLLIDDYLEVAQGEGEFMIFAAPSWPSIKKGSSGSQATKSFCFALLRSFPCRVPPPFS